MIMMMMMIMMMIMMMMMADTDDGVHDDDEGMMILTGLDYGHDIEDDDNDAHAMKFLHDLRFYVVVIFIPRTAGCFQ